MPGSRRPYSYKGGQVNKKGVSITECLFSLDLAALDRHTRHVARRHWRIGPARLIRNGPMYFRADFDGVLTPAERAWLDTICRESRQTKAGRRAIRRAWARCGRAIGLSGRKMAAEYRLAYRAEGRETVLLRTPVQTPEARSVQYGLPLCPKRRFRPAFNDGDGRRLLGTPIRAKPCSTESNT